jgi:Ubiquitin-conjugating enzyme
MSASTARRDIDVERVRALAAASAGRIGVVTLPMAGRPRFVLDLGYSTAGSPAYPRERQASSRIAIDLAQRHPFQPPLTTVLTPVFHPHVFGSGVVCIGARWLPGEGMDLFVQRVVRLLAFDPLLMNPNSIANAAANIWYRSALLRHPQAFPTDPAAIAWQAGGPSAGGRVVRQCPHCDVSLRLPAGRSGAVQCPRCGGEFEVGT